MLAYRSLKIIADFWLHVTEALQAAEVKLAQAVDKTVAYGQRLDNKAVQWAHDAHEKLVTDHRAALEKTATVVDEAESEGKRIIAAAEAQAVLLVSRARTIENDAIDAYAAGIKKAHAFLNDAIYWHA